MDNRIESLTLTVGKLFSENYVVPRYQREFVWKEDQVNQLLNDIFDSFNNESPSDYFIGSTVVCKNKDGMFEIIDGQQRLTTIYITLCVLRDLIEEYTPHGEKPQTEFIKTLISHFGNNSEGNQVHRYILNLSYSDSRDILVIIANGEMSNIKDMGFTKSMTSIYNAYKSIVAFMDDEFGQEAASIRKFAAYLKDKVNLIRIETKDVSQALRIFETINSRGVSLNPMDLLKNLIFMKALPAEFEKISENWKNAMGNIDYTREPPSRFLIYYVTAFHSEKAVNENQIYQWFLDHPDIYKSPLVFSRDILKASESFKFLVDGNNPDGSENRYLKNIKLQNSKSTRHLVPLLAASKKDKEFTEELAKFLEILLFIHMITSTNTRKLDTKFIEISRKLSKTSKLTDLKDYIDRQMDSYRKDFADRFVEAFSSPNFGITHRTKLRYIVGKLSQYVNENAYGSAGADAKIQTFVNPDVEIEHILPINPSINARSEFGDPRSISLHTHKLGNLALIEKSINGSLGNKPYSKKKSVYGNSKFLLTRSISGNNGLGNTLITKAVAELSHFEHWKPESIDLRTSQLIELARKIWGMDEKI